jgi:imidazolonepropionase-like amidohydrolase
MNMNFNKNRMWNVISLLARRCEGVLVAGMLLGLSTVVGAHDQIPGAPQTRPIALVGGQVFTVSGPAIDGGTVIFDEGKIVAVGKDLPLPENAEVVDVTGQNVYPGLIESMTDLGLREIESVEVTIDSRETGEQNANVRSWIALNPDSELIPVARAGGIMTALIAPNGSGIKGQAGVLALDGWTASEMIIRAPAGLCVNWESMEPRGREGSDSKARETKLAELDELLEAALRYEQQRLAAPETTPTHLPLEGLLPLLHGEVPLIAEANRQRVIESAIAYAAERGLKLIIVGGYDAERCAGLLKQYDVPVLVTATYRLPFYRNDPYDASYTLPERLRRAGVRFAICSNVGDASNARNLPYHAGNAVAYGLPQADGLRAITLSAAEILGVDAMLGSLDVGKQATLIVTNGNVLDSGSQVTRAYIRGALVDLSSRHTMLDAKYREKYRRLREK